MHTSVLLLLLTPALAFLAPQTRSAVRVQGRSTDVKMGMDIQTLIADSKQKRLDHLEAQAMDALKVAVDQFDNAVFPNAMIVGDCIITHLLHKIGALQSGKAKIMVVDTFHLFDSTMPFLESLEKKYEFKATVFQAEGCANKDEYDKKFGADLWKVDIEQYDKVCKVEPFQRGLKTMGTDCMINGRTRWQGNERAYIDIAEVAPIGGGLAKMNPLAYWTFEDCFDYAAANGVPLHPTVALGYPSQGDAKDTVPIPDPDGRNHDGIVGEAGSVRWVNGEWIGDKKLWLDYGKERIGRFVGLVNKDGSTKTECGIHVEGAEKTFDRDLFEKGVTNLATQADAKNLVSGNEEGLMVVYAPWCQFCQAMEADFEKLAGDAGVKLYKYRGDEDREFVSSSLNTQSFPTINYVSKDGKVTKYESEKRDVASLKAFVSSKQKASA